MSLVLFFFCFSPHNAETTSSPFSGGAVMPMTRLPYSRHDKRNGKHTEKHNGEEQRLCSGLPESKERFVGVDSELKTSSVAVASGKRERAST